MLKGTGVSAGVAQGTAYVVACGYRSAVPQRNIRASEVDGERARFDEAVSRADAELVKLQNDVRERIGPSQAEIFGAHRLVLKDASLRDRVLRAIEEKRVNLEASVAGVFEEYARSLEGISDGYLRERASDIHDVRRRVLSALAERPGRAGPKVPDGAIVVSDELLPSVTARFELDHVRAFVTERGNKFSHSSILARSLGTPAVAGVPGASVRIKTGDRIIVDGVAGVVFVNPDSAIEREYERLAVDLRTSKEELRHLVDLPTVTLDGTALPLLANVNKFSDTEAAFLYNADGIGLYRTEFTFSIRSAFPTEEEQHEFLERAAERMHPRKLVFRLVDLGGDKILPYFPLPPSRNPSLAERGIRLLLRHPEVLKPQLRAFLRVSARHPISVLLPVVVGLEDVRQARQVVRQVQDELSAEGKPFNRDIPVGAMIEVPSAALMSRTLANELDFLSLGTNDLVQYVLAADREDESTAPYYQPLHPAVLRLIESVVEAARSAGRELSICGEMAGDPLHTALLLGLGLRELSVAPGQMLEVKNAIRRTRLEDARQLARIALELGSASEIEALLNEQQPKTDRRELPTSPAPGP
ncbi:MAG TPA: phosphoenolpyruvate--protein phosphotransferase [Myxococcales bacterium]